MNKLRKFNSLDAEDEEAIKLLRTIKFSKDKPEKSRKVPYDRQTEPSRIVVSIHKPWQHPPAIVRFNKRAWNGVATTYFIVEFLTTFFNYLVLQSAVYYSSSRTTSAVFSMLFMTSVFSSAILLLFMISYSGRRKLGVLLIVHGILHILIEIFCFYNFPNFTETAEKSMFYDLAITRYISQLLRFVLICCYVHHGIRFELFHRRKVAIFE